jgi:Zn-dependent M28 family amino/carboxypeptidase
MKHLIAISAFLLANCISFAQKDMAAKFASTITVTDLKKHLTIIAGEEMEGRETGSPGERKAAAYIQQQFKSMGLQPFNAKGDYQQYFPLYQDTLVKAITSINGVKGVIGKDFLTPLTLNNNLNLPNKNIQFVGYGIDDPKYSDYTNLNVNGKIVIFFSGEPKSEKYLTTGTSFMSDWSYSINKKLKTAKEKGALAAFVINTYQDEFTQKDLEKNQQTSLNFNYYPSKVILNHSILSHAYAKKVFGENFVPYLTEAKKIQPFSKQLKRFKTAKATFAFARNKNTVYSSNVLGTLEGTDKKDEFVFITAHYDHLGKHDGKIYYGADDDGSGTCGVIEMAEAFAQAAKAGNRPRRTIVFMTVSGEEKGLWGSEFYSDNPIYPLDKTTVDLNIDMVGRIDTERTSADSLNYVYVIGHDKLSSDLPIINEGMNNKYTQLTLDYKFDDPNDTERIYYRSDHYNFARKGVPVLFFYDGMLLGDYHKPTDTVDKIYWDVYEKRVKMIFHTAWEMANRDEMIVRDKPLPEGER